MSKSIFDHLETRIGRLHVRQRLGIEAEYEARVFHKGSSVFHLENWYSVHSLIKNSLRLAGLYGRGRRNACNIQVRHHDVPLVGLPPTFDGYTILHISDPHVDLSQDITHVLIERIREVDYDLCVFTGDYRAKTFGPCDATLAAMLQVRSHLRDPVYGILGNHDTIRMVPELEAMGIRMLLNEWIPLERGGAQVYLVGIDDAHYYRVDNIQKAAHDVPHEEISILLSHTPETYREAAHADFNLMLCGHTHGGQICLPGGIPVLTDAHCPRHMAKGPWTYHKMIGYTSVGAGATIVDVRLNCLPEITLHHLRCA